MSIWEWRFHWDGTLFSSCASKNSELQFFVPLDNHFIMEVWYRFQNVGEGCMDEVNDVGIIV
ncbi:unnamed protein product, partial [Sphenostylis stenocarpa]